MRYDLLERPVVIEGGAAHLEACSRWSPEYLVERVGSVHIDFKLSASHCHPNFRASTLGEMFARGHGTVAELIEQVTTGEPNERARRLFTGDERFLLRKRGDSVEVDKELAVLLDDVSVPPLFAPERLYTVWGWLSGAGVHTWLHYDNNGCHNLNAQITGHKRCVLYPPSALPHMRPFALGGDNPAYNCCAVDIDREPDALAGIEGYEAELHPGDLLFIPRYWFHAFDHLGQFNTNVNFWYLPERPAHNAVAVRQALIDAASRAGLVASKDSAVARVLSQLDEALVDPR